MARAISREANISVLLVEDDAALRFALAGSLRRVGFAVIEAATCASALAALDASPDIVITDLRLPDGDALSLMPRVRKLAGDVPVLIVTGHGTIELAVRAVKEGATDFLTKPIDPTTVAALVSATVENRRRQRSGARRRVVLPETGVVQSAAMRRIDEQVERLRDADCSVLLLGETGTGKSVLARRIHCVGARNAAPFVEINCAGLAKEFVESELFGHDKGAFTGAHAPKQGLFEAASGGTLFLDEIGDIDLQVQPKLLKVLEDKRFRRMGEVRERSADVRIVAATHHDLLEASTKGRFRADLYYRISTVTIVVPALRERREDIVPLARRMLEELGAPDVEISSDAQEALRHHGWRGNLRELKNVLERALLLLEGPVLRQDDLRFDRGSSRALAAAEPHEGPAVASTSRTLSEVEREHIQRALVEEGGRVEAAARRLGIPRSTLYQRIKAYGILPSKLRKLGDERGSDPPASG